MDGMRALSALAEGAGEIAIPLAADPAGPPSASMLA